MFFTKRRAESLNAEDDVTQDTGSRPKINPQQIILDSKCSSKIN